MLPYIFYLFPCRSFTFILSIIIKKEDKWQSMMAELKREKDKMLAEGSEAPIAAQWRQRYMNVCYCARRERC